MRAKAALVNVPEVTSKVSYKELTTDQLGLL